MNRSEIQDLINYLGTVPDERFDISKWFGSTVVTPSHIPVEDGYVIPTDCGTVACIAGHNYFRRGNTNQPFHHEHEIKSLGLEHIVGSALFVPLPRLLGDDEDGNPIYSFDEYTRTAAIRVLRNLLEMGRVDWDRAIREDQAERAHAEAIKAVAGEVNRMVVEQEPKALPQSLTRFLTDTPRLARSPEVVDKPPSE